MRTGWPLIIVLLVACGELPPDEGEETEVRRDAACATLSSGMVSITLDDGFASQYTLARPALRAHGMKATLFLITDRVGQGWKGYLTMGEAQAMISDGDEIASHTVTHPGLSQLSATQIDYQLRASKQWLQQHLGVNPIDFASPFGDYDGRVVAAARRYYETHATVRTGLNFPGADAYALRRDTVFAYTTPAHVMALVSQAKSQRGWLILLFHDFTTGTPKDMYRYRAADFGAVLDDIAASGLPVVTVRQGAARIRCP